MNLRKLRKLLNWTLIPVGLLFWLVMLLGIVQHGQVLYYLPWIRGGWGGFTSPWMWLTALPLGYSISAGIGAVWHWWGPGAIARRQQEALRQAPPRRGEYE